jgi:iron complex outermembrane recepter protein
MRTSHIILNRLRAGASFGALLVMAHSFPLLAQTAAPAAIETSEDEIIVTGSRIPRADLELPNPIVTLTGKLIEESGDVNVTDALLRNPALSASTGSGLSGGRDAGFGETGVNVLDLRNLGTNRTLVLVNGQRHVAGIPNSAAVDINTIPQDLIDRVDVLTGGVSAVYGADGVSGVVNFILKRNFEGFRARGQAGISDKGDAGQQFGSVVIGKNFAEDRGNIALAYEFAKNERLSSFDRPFSGDPLRNRQLLRDLGDFPDNPNRFDRVIQTNVTWADSAPDGAVDLDLDGIPDFTGSGRPYDRGIVLRGAGGRAIGGSNTPTAGYFGDIAPATQRHVINLLTSYEFSPAFKLYADGKYVRASAFSVGQPSFDFFTFLEPDNAFLAQRFGAGAAPDGAYISRDNFDLGIRGESNKRETYRGVIGAEGEISGNARYDVSYVYGRNTARTLLTSNLIGDRFFAALDAVRDPITGRIVCRTTLDPTAAISGFAGAPTTFTPGTNSTCRPLNLLGQNVATPEALSFVLADNVSNTRVTQQVLSGSVVGDFDSLFKLPGGSLGFAVGAEYRRETSKFTPDALVVSGALRDFSQQPISGGKFNVKEVFAELRAPILSKRPFFELLEASAAIRLSDYSTIGKTTTWNVSGIYAPITDLRFRGSYSKSVRAPNIGELFDPVGGSFLFVTDPCDVTRLGDGSATRQANCSALLSGLGLSAAQIANFSPSTDAQNTTSRRGLAGGNVNLKEETATTWTAGVVITPSFVKNLSFTVDYFNIRIKDAVRTTTPTELAELCVDAPTIQNQFCSSIFRARNTGFVLGDGNDPTQQIGFITGPQNVAQLRTVGVDFAARYNFKTSKLGDFAFGVVGSYLKKYDFTPSVGGTVENNRREFQNPRWRGNFNADWKLNALNISYNLTWQEGTRRFELEQITANPDLSDPRFFFVKAQWEHDIRIGYDVNEKFNFYVGVNNLTDQKPDFADFNYPVSGIGRFVYVGAKIKLDKLF